tara:strand:+ start:210 stop:539 length:330 start_codon:yes stop_codon:yes gene_type:complete
LKLFLNIFFFSTLITNCTAPIDYFGNNINLHEESIYLSELRDQKNDKFILVFKGRFNSYSDSDMVKREVTLNRYIKLIKKFYGFTKSTIIFEEVFGVITPRYYVTIQFE